MDFAYIATGPSMKPTLCVGDLLAISVYGERKVVAGDVVLFASPIDGRKVAHRVIAVQKTCIRTKGDNNRSVDSWFLTPGDIIGQVVCVRRGKKQIRIHGAALGRLCVIKLKTIRFTEKSISFICGGLYRYLSRRQLLYGYSRLLFKPRLVIFNRMQGKDLQLVLGRNFVIGRRMPGKKWQIRWPFRFLVHKAYQ